MAERLHKLYLTDNYTETNCAQPYPSPSMATSRRCVLVEGGGRREQGAWKSRRARAERLTHYSSHSPVDSGAGRDWVDPG